MSTAVHTPGPWHAYQCPDEGGEYAIRAQNGICVALSIGGTKSEASNARLIAAAPELLEALELVVEHWTKQFERGGHLAPEWRKKARSAIAKATGEQQ